MNLMVHLYLPSEVKVKKKTKFSSLRSLRELDV